MDRITDKTVLITGGGAGIGFALAASFGRRGARVVIVDLDEGRLESAAGRLNGAGIAASTFAADVRDRERMRAVADDVKDSISPVDILCNNAGVTTWGPVSESSPEDIEFAMGVNFWGVANSIAAFLPHLLDQNRGHIVNVASMSGLVGMANLGAYCASKFAVVGLSEALARELKPHGIGVTIVCPMVVDTDINQHSAELRRAERPDARRQADPGALVGGVISADRVAEEVVAAVVDGAPYVLTHPEQRAILARRAARIDAAAASAQEL